MAFEVAIYVYSSFLISHDVNLLAWQRRLLLETTSFSPTEASL